MPMLIYCARGCGHAINVSDEVIQEAQSNGVPIEVSHEAGKCPGTPGKLPDYRYRLRVLVDRFPLDDTGGIDDEFLDDPTLLIQNGAEVDGDSLSDVFDTLSDKLTEQWHKAHEMRHLAEQ